MVRLIRFRCKCGKKLKAGHDIIGKKVKCTRCPRIHRVPKSDQLGPKKSRLPEAQKNVTSDANRSAAVADRPSLLASSQGKTTSTPAPTLRPKITASIAKPPVLISSGVAEASLMPKENEGSDARFKLDPLLSPAPSDELTAPADSADKFDFDLESINIETDFPAPVEFAESSQNKSNVKKKNTKTKSLSPQAKASPTAAAMLSRNRVPLMAGGVVAGALIFAVVGYLTFFSGTGYPQEFSQRPEVQDYIATMRKFRDKKITFSLMSEAYIKAKTPAESELDAINAFRGEIEPLDNQDETLEAALEFFKSFQPEKARETLISATQNLSNKIPELEAKAKDYSSKLR